MPETSLPCTPSELLTFLKTSGIVCQTNEHAAVFTVEESQALKESLEPGTPGGPGSGHVKNLFLKNKKGQMWLLTLKEDKRLDINAFSKHVGSQRLSFASADRLMENLGVKPGSVTPLALINNPELTVTFLLDEDLLSDEFLHVHPLTNTMTTMMSPTDLGKFLELLGRKIQTIKIC